jgi:ABC-type multidrug transport system fused ATPase/permease subunit
MARAVVRTSIGWFEANPLGRVLNRFSSDISVIDTEISDQVGCLVLG